MFERLRRHPVLLTFFLLLCATGVALTLFLRSFDLNDYRSQLQTTLATKLERPVTIGAIHFTLRHGLSLELSNAAIGAPGDPATLSVDHLILRLRISPLLLDQQLSFSSIFLDGAQLRIVETPGEGKATAAKESTPGRMNTLIDLLRRTNISSLTLRNGQVTLENKGRRYELEGIKLQLRDIAFTGPIPVTAEGTLSSGALRAPWQLSGEIEAAGADAPWTSTRIDLTCKVKGIDLAHLPGADGSPGQNVRFGGTAELTARLRGTPISGLTFEVRSAGEDLSLHLPKLYRAPLTAKEIVVGGIWQQEKRGTIRDLNLRIDNLALHGEVLLPTAEAPLLATLASPEFPLSSLGRLIPDRSLPLLATALRDPAASGSAGIENLTLQWSSAQGFQLDHAGFYFKNGRFTLQGMGLVENAAAQGMWQEGALTIKTVKANLLGGVSEANGNMTFPEQGEPLFNFKLASTAKADALIPLLPTAWQDRLQASGPVSFSGKVGGTRSRLLLDLQSRFNDAAVSFNHIPLKRAGEIGDLLILGAADHAGLELSHSLLTLPFAEARANGRFALDTSGGYVLACDISNLIIEKLPPFLAVQKELQGRGKVDLRLDLNGDKSGLKHIQGSGEFHELGMHLWDAVANLHGASGRMTITREGMSFPAISGLLGLSPVQASAELKWLPAFKLTLDLDLNNTRAADLVFKSPKKTFSAVRGRLVISRAEILFEKISARIADETAALINGRFTYDPARVDLDIEASQANIDGIIALWQHGEKKAGHPAAATGHHPLVVDINVNIAAGDLYGVAFQQARGTISLRDGKLVIQPLQLNIGAGSASVAIATGPLHDEYPLLKVSGEAEKIDAAQVQKQLLGRQGSITGTLSGTFFLQGEIGRYLPTCNGNVNLRLSKGLLRGFTSISRALALFNVGKILTFHFPDVANDGLLFDRVKGNLIFNDGVLRSEDLAIASAAFDMAFVGKADLAKDQLDFIIGVKPLQTVDKVLSSIPLAGWILTGEKKAFVIANFHVTGSSQDPQVEAIPFSSLSDMAVGIFKRTFGLPGKIVNDVKELFK